MAAVTDVIIQRWVRNDERELIYEYYSIAILCDIKLRYSSYKFVFNLPQYKTAFNGIKVSTEEKAFLEDFKVLQFHELSSTPCCPYRTQDRKLKDTLPSSAMSD